MTKVLKMLGSMGLVAVMGVALLGAASMASAESPPAPPARFAGTVLVNGAQPPAGTTIEARVGTTSCGVTTTFNQGGNSNYVLDVPALDPGATPNCGTEDAVVTFFVGGQQANETGLWRNYQLNVLNLTVTAQTATPGTPTTATPTPTVKGPDTGNAGLAETSSDSAAPMLFVVIGLGAVAFGIGGTAVARRSR